MRYKVAFAFGYVSAAELMQMGEIHMGGQFEAREKLGSAIPMGCARQVGARRVACLMGLAAAWAASAHAQDRELPLWPGPPPGTEQWHQTERVIDDTPIGRVIQNVTIPTLTAFLPEPGKSTGLGVIVVPGGAFVAVTWGLEGEPMARWLQERGIAAFVLKYRVPERKGEGMPAAMDMDAAGRYAVADGVQALSAVRAHAREWHVDPKHIGVLGFSAGAMVASELLVQPQPNRRPDFAALVYGAPFGALPVIPDNLPPTFMIWAADDVQAAPSMTRFEQALRAKGHRPEVHVYAAGGHGFALRSQGLSVDHWTDALANWLRNLPVRAVPAPSHDSSSRIQRP